MQHQRAHTELNKLTLTHTHVHTMEFPGGPAPRTQRFHIFTLSRAVGEVNPASHAAWPRRKTHAHTHTRMHTCLFSLSHSYRFLFLWRTLTDSWTAFCTAVLSYPDTRGLPGGSDNKESACNAVDAASIPGSGKFMEKGMATHPSTLAWRIPWTEEPGGLQSTRSQRVRHD